MAVRFNDRLLARELRQRGFSFGEIIAKIPNLSKGTLSSWLKDIELTDGQKVRIINKVRSAANRGRVKGAFKNHEKRVLITKKIFLEAEKDIKRGNLDLFFVSGIMLYWAEGRKSAEIVEMTNSDPEMIAFMMKWFRKYCRVNEKKFRVRINIHSLLDRKETEGFWSDITGVPYSQFNKTIVKDTKLLGKRNLRYLGTCSIVISDKSLFRRILGWKRALIKQFQLKAPVA